MLKLHPKNSTRKSDAPLSGERREPRDAGPKAAKLEKVALLSDARRRRALMLLRDEEPPDQEAEARAWGDR